VIVSWQGVQVGDANAARFTWSHRAVMLPDGRVEKYAHRALFGEISFACAGQADCKTKMDLIESLFAVPYGDLLVLNDDGSNSTNCVASSATLQGVKPGSLTWSDRPGAQFTTWRSFAIDFEWETRAPGLGAGFLVEFSETVRITGGTPKTVVQEPINIAVSAYDEFVLVPKQKYVVTQQGRAVGLTGLPAAQAPLYANPSGNSYATTTPQRNGPAGYERFAVEWSYSWEFGALASLPIANLWPVGS
jgi:hypothetical protein